jgi:lipoprotein-anchoring transpeptidase ErfK/SrfK
VIADEQRRDADERLWVRVPLSALPNGQEGWVPRDALGDFHGVRTHLIVDRARLRAYLLRDGRLIFETRIGVGRPRWPTPAGEFYVRVRLQHFRDSFYGPIAFGTNARSPWLTDWPKGGVVGIHGTNTPRLLPGRVSHGCIRMRNAAIRRLARLMPLGTPVTIR